MKLKLPSRVQVLSLLLAFFMGVGAVGLYRWYWLNELRVNVLSPFVEMELCKVIPHPADPGQPGYYIWKDKVECFDGSYIHIPKVY